MSRQSKPRLSIAVIGTGISGLSAAWLLNQRHDITVFEQDPRIGGHSHTIDVVAPTGSIPVDTGFIVYNPLNYPNLTRLFEHLGVATKPAEMSFGVSRCDGELEYAGSSVRSLFAQWRNAFNPRFWAMLTDLRRFYREAPLDLSGSGDGALTLGEYLEQNGYSDAFCDEHLLPMAAAIWSAPAKAMRECSAAAFIRFFDNHGLLLLRDRPQWRTVVGGSRAYVERLSASFQDRIVCEARVVSVSRTQAGVDVTLASGETRSFDHAVIASHSDQALAMLSDASPEEQRLLGAIRYRRNRVVLHGDGGMMPRRRSAWSSWNYVHSGAPADGEVHITYWMNRLQGLPRHTPLFVTLDPKREPKWPIHSQIYSHPVFDAATFKAQQELWSLQGQRNTWFCGAYFGAGFHEDGLQAGLAVAEDLGGIRRPWSVPNESGRIARLPSGRKSYAREAA